VSYWTQKDLLIMSFWVDLDHSYDNYIVHPGKEQAFWLLVSFLFTFLMVRVLTHAIKNDHGPFHNIRVKGRHVHHLVPGIILVLISGYLSVALHLRITRTLDAVVFGIGAALTLDEFALWLNLKDVYWIKQGRSSVDAVVIAAVFASLVVLGSGFWIGIGHLIF
jgi:hypothetical protein